MEAPSPQGRSEAKDALCLLSVFLVLYSMLSGLTILSRAILCESRLAGSGFSHPLFSVSLVLQMHLNLTHAVYNGSCQGRCTTQIPDTFLYISRAGSILCARHWNNAARCPALDSLKKALRRQVQFGLCPSSLWKILEEN